MNPETQEDDSLSAATDENSTQMKLSMEKEWYLAMETLLRLGNPIVSHSVELVELPANNMTTALPQLQQEKQQQLDRQYNLPSEKRKSLFKLFVSDDDQLEQQIAQHQENLELTITREQLRQELQKLILLEHQVIQPKIENRKTNLEPAQQSFAKRIKIENPNNEQQQFIDAGEQISLGYYNTKISRKAFDGLPWQSASLVVRKLLRIAFGRNKLAVSNLSGKSTKALVVGCKRPRKEMLNPEIVSDITECVTERCNISVSQIRKLIRFVCSDEARCMRNNQLLSVFSNINDENIN